MALINIKNLVGVVVYPPGSIYISTQDTNPAEVWGGTWERFGNGRSLVGVDENDTDFATVKKEIGSKTHTLTSAEMPSHTHTFTGTAVSHYHLMGVDYDGKTGSTRWSPYGSGSGTKATSATAITAAGTNSTTGGGGAHNNMQPYTTVYMWERKTILPLKNS